MKAAVLAATSFGFSAFAENAAAGNGSASATFCQWKTSSGHNENMLRSGMSHTGIGHNARAGGSYSSYWSSNFGYASGSDDVSLSVPGCQLPGNLPGC